MSSVTQPLPSPSATRTRWPKTVAIAIVLLIAAAFIFHYVFPYYLHHNQAGFGAYWSVRFWLLAHITCGMTALLIGPLQFSQRIRQRYLNVHRIAGRVYVIAVLLGCTVSVRLAIHETIKSFGFSLGALAFAWATTTLMAFYAIRHRHIAVHKDWMVRSYVVTFAFVTFRFLTDYTPLFHQMPISERITTNAWLSWAVPLLITDVILQLKNLRHAPSAKAHARPSPQQP